MPLVRRAENYRAACRRVNCWYAACSTANMMKATGSYKQIKWDEHSFEQVSPEMKMTKASAVFSFFGEIEGEADVEYVMYYKYYDPNEIHKANAKYVGLMRLAGKLNGKIGSFVMEDSGKFEEGEASSELKIIPGSGTGELEGITGSAKYQGCEDNRVCEINYELH